MSNIMFSDIGKFGKYNRINDKFRDALYVLYNSRPAIPLLELLECEHISVMNRIWFIVFHGEDDMITKWYWEIARRAVKKYLVRSDITIVSKWARDWLCNKRHDIKHVWWMQQYINNIDPPSSKDIRRQYDHAGIIVDLCESATSLKQISQCKKRTAHKQPHFDEEYCLQLYDKLSAFIELESHIIGTVHDQDYLARFISSIKMLNCATQL